MGTFVLKVTFFEKQDEYSVKKARGEYTPEKIEWWEIYKWADRMLARRKVKKEVNKASRVKPAFVSKVKLFLLCVFFGWFGVHNFYAKNIAKGWTVLSLMTISIIVVVVEPLTRIMGVFVGGGFAFIVVTMWIYDLVSIILNRYKYKTVRMQFIRKLNVETRAKLGKKYINMK